MRVTLIAAMPLLVATGRRRLLMWAEGEWNRR